MNFEGQNISLHDALFVDNITGDLENFRVRSSSIARVLVFPPVNNYHRFLIHKVVETGFPQFTTFSVGEGLERRTVVCFQQHLLEHTLKLAQSPEELASIPANKEAVTQDTVESTEKVLESNKDTKAEESPEENKSTIVQTTTSESKSELDEVEPETINPEKQKDEGCDETERNVSDSTETDTQVTENSLEISPAEEAVKSDIVDEYSELLEEKDMKIKKENQLDKSNEVENGSSMDEPDPATKSQGDDARKRRSKRPAMAVYVPPRGRSSAPVAPKPSTPTKSTVGTPVKQDPLRKVENGEKAVVPDDLDVTEQVVSEITVAVGGVQIEGPEVNYLSFQTSDSTINIDQFGHVIELYDFPSEYKTNNLVDAFPAFTSRWDIKWVDDTHALGVFSSSEVAAEALAVRHPTIHTRPLNMATPQSKCKARSVLEELLPYKPRPVSCTAPARRLLQWALGSGMRVPEASKQENERLKEARRRKEEGKRRESGQNEDIKKRREEVLQVRVEKKYRHDEHDHR